MKSPATVLCRTVGCSDGSSTTTTKRRSPRWWLAIAGWCSGSAVGRSATRSNKQIAADLGLALGVVEGRLKRGKDRLRLSLVRRGVGLTVALAAVGLSAGAIEAATTDSLVAATARAAVAYRGGTPPAGNYSQGAMRLAEQELAMSTSTVGVTTWGVAVALVLTGLTLGWAGDTARHPSQAEEPQIAATALAASPAALAADEDAATVELAPAEKEKSYPRQPSPSALAEKKIEEELGGPTTLDFIDTPLQDLVDSIMDMHKIKVLIDDRALEDVGVDLDEPVTFNLSDVSLQSALNHMLRPLDLTWTIRDEVLLITTPEEVEQILITKVYDVGDLVTCRDKAGDLWADYDTLVEVITTTVEPDTWEDVGGPGSVEAAPFAGAEMLVISQAYPVHGQIERLLEQLRAIAQEKGVDEPPTREKPEPRPLKGGFFPGMPGSQVPPGEGGFGGGGGGGGGGMF